MTRLFAIVGWGVLGGAILSALIVLQAAVSPPRRRVPVPAFETGATFARLGTAEGPRLVVTSLRSGAPTGLRVGDRIEAVGGRPVTTLAGLDRNVAGGPYDEIDLRVLRDGELRDIHVARRRSGGEP